MRRSCFTQLSGKDAFLRLLLGIFIGGNICLFSCEDDVDRSSFSSDISLTSEIRSSWSSSTRSAADTDVPQGTVTALQGGGTALYLHTLYVDSIASPSSGSRSDTSLITRAAPVTNETMYNTFGVSAFSYTDSWSESKTPNYFHNIAASKSGSSYTLSSTHYWPGASYKMKFFAYAPKDNGQYVLSGKAQAGSPTISVTIPGNVGDQKDLLVAQSPELQGNSNTAVSLAFNHALTAIRFVCGKDMQAGTVKSVSLKNVYSKGAYHMGNKSWSGQNTKTTFSQTLNKSTTGTAGDSLTTEAQTFMMLPQTLPEGAQLEVVFTDSARVDHTLTAVLKNTEWPMGKTVTYKISSSSINWTYELKVTAPAGFTHNGGAGSYSVTSYRQNTLGVKEPIAWTAQFLVDGNWTTTKPDWLTGFTASGAGGTSAQSFNATVAAQSGVENGPHTEVLRKATAKGSSANPYNLSNSKGESKVENTANCYVVNAPGFYSFPLVYGNAIKGGNTNNNAYVSQLTDVTILRELVNHTGNAISNPYISNNANCNPDKAELVWQDAPSLVTDIQYKSGNNGGSISFKVDKEHIRQGNAVIAIKDRTDQVLWSWHIWVTDADIYHTIEVTTRAKKKYAFMPVCLGWCDDSTTTYAERSCTVKFTAGGQSKEIVINQAAHSIVTKGNYPYYQWGRKDPFLPSDGQNSGNKTWYAKDGTSSKAVPVENLSSHVEGIKNSILKPHVMQNFAGDKIYYNLWSTHNKEANMNDNPISKSVYDPCPVGFKLPASAAFTGFTESGIGTGDRSKINGTWDGAKNGWNIYTNSDKKQTIFFPGLGWRNTNGNLDKFREGYYWTAIPYGDPINARCLATGDVWGVHPEHNLNKVFGAAVFPDKDIE